MGALYGNTLGNDLVWDDRLTAAAPSSPGTIVGQRTGPYYRPLVMLSFAADRALSGAAPVGYHLTNLVAHGAVAWLLGRLALTLGQTSGAALAASLLFAAHPVQTEAVSYVSGRTDVLCALFVLLAVLAWRRSRRVTDGWAVASGAAVAAALLCKETAALVPLALFAPGAHPAARPPRPWLPLLAAVVWGIGWGATGGVAAGGAAGMDALAGRLPAIGVVALSYLRLLLWPADLHLERFVAVGGWSLPAVLATWATLAALAAALAWSARRVAGGFVLLALATLTYLPAAGIVPVYPAIAGRALFAAEHFLYLPLLGLVPLVVGAAAGAMGRARRTAPALVAALLVAWGAVVVARNRDWRDEETLFRQTLAYEPPSARVWFNLGNLALGAGRLDEAIRLYRAALVREPGDGAAHLNLGIALQRARQYAEAEAEYRRAVATAPEMSEAQRGLAALLAARGETAEAAQVLERLHAAPLLRPGTSPPAPEAGSRPR